jgi:hypothetical protein
VRALLKSQANEVLALMSANDIEPKEFQWIMEPSRLLDYQANKIFHKNTGYYFLFDFSSKIQSGKNYPYYVEYYPNNLGRKTDINIWDWESALTEFKDWIKIMKKEIEAEDPWNIFNADNEQFAGSFDDIDNEPFNENDQKVISSRLKEIENYFTNYDEISEDNMIIIKKQLDYLIDCSKRMGRKDWYLVAYGTIFALLAGLALPPAISHKIFNFIVISIANVLRTPPLLF